MARAKIVAVVSQKGGVGKSTLCQLVAREAAVGGKTAKILDFDVKQMTSTDWVRARLERDVEPAVEAEPTKNLEKALKHSKGYDLIVLDGAPGAPKRTAELVPMCDLIVLPTGASRADLTPTLVLARRIVEMKLTVDGPVFALCRVMTASETAETRAAIANAGFETLDGELIERPGYRQAQNLGRSLTETNFPSLNDKARQLARSVLDRLAWNAIPIKQGRTARS
ncbi:MAG: ParA family protein [Alphaproteobacteria bacterium]|nr:ParA family protein [Alphaproteobacteria bacterium]